jgi:hypothetical protein
VCIRRFLKALLAHIVVCTDGTLSPNTTYRNYPTFCGCGEREEEEEEEERRGEKEEEEKEKEEEEKEEEEKEEEEKEEEEKEEEEEERETHRVWRDAEVGERENQRKEE